MNDPGSEENGDAADARLREDLEALKLPRDGFAVRRNRPLRWILPSLLLCGVAVAAWQAVARGPLSVETVTAETLDEAALEPVPVLSGSGYLVPAQPFVAVGSRIAGRIARYRVDEGDRVKRGDPLVELETRPLQAVTDQARASLVSARARLELAEAELGRARELFRGGVLAREALDRRESEARVARASVHELDAMLQRAEIDLEDTVIRAPTDGVVLETYKQPGEVAVPGGFSGSGDLLRMADLSELRAELDVNEADLLRVALGQRAEVVPDAFPEARYAARVVKLAPQIDRQKGTRKIEVVVLWPDEKLLPDMSVRVVFLAELETPKANAARSAVIPPAALRRDPAAGTFVWLAEAGEARRVPVVVGQVVGNKAVIQNGLAGGERVIVGTPPEREGQRVVSPTD